MKAIGIISTAALSLLLGIAVPAYAQQDQHEQEQKDKPEQQQRKQEQAKREQAGPEQQHAQRQQKQDQNKQQEQQQARGNERPQRTPEQQRVEQTAWQQHRPHSGILHTDCFPVPAAPRASRATSESCCGTRNRDWSSRGGLLLCRSTRTVLTLAESVGPYPN
jgi:glucan-binding YG repeat protein